MPSTNDCPNHPSDPGPTPAASSSAPVLGVGQGIESAFVSLNLIYPIRCPTDGDHLTPESWPRVYRPAWRHLSRLGVVSFSFYLLHQPIVGASWQILTSLLPEVRISRLMLFAVCVAWYLPLLLIARFALRWLEEPSVRLGREVWPAFKGRLNAGRRAKADAVTASA